MSSHTGGWSTPPRDAHLQLSPNTPTLPNLERTPLLQKSKHYLLKASHFRKGPLNDNFLGISWTCKPHVPPQSDWEWPRGVLSLFLTSFQTESSAWLSLRSSLSTQPWPYSHHSCPSNPQRHWVLNPSAFYPPHSDLLPVQHQPMAHGLNTLENFHVLPRVPWLCLSCPSKSPATHPCRFH